MLDLQMAAGVALFLCVLFALVAIKAVSKVQKSEQELAALKGVLQSAHATGYGTEGRAAELAKLEVAELRKAAQDAGVSKEKLAKADQAPASERKGLLIPLTLKAEREAPKKKN